jgi:hypothetical protein
MMNPPIRWVLLGALALSLALFGPATAQRQMFGADSQISVVSTIVANNTTPILILGRSGSVYQVDAYNNGTALAYVKLYNLAAVPAACGTGTPQARYLIPFGTSSSGSGFVAANINGDAYSNGIVMCVTGAIADNDTTAPSATTFIVNVHFKPGL